MKIETLIALCCSTLTTALIQKDRLWLLNFSIYDGQKLVENEASESQGALLSVNLSRIFELRSRLKIVSC